MQTKLKLSILSMLLGIACQSGAQILPKGIGAFSFGYRQLTSDAQLFDENGRQYGAGEKFNLDFSAQGMAAGKAGSDLKKLYDEIKKFEPQGTTDSVADQMDFGALTGDVTTNFNAVILGAGYGLTDRLTLVFGIPIVSASVDTKLHFTGTNNALEIKEKLGSLVFKEIQDGLDKAAALSEENIREQIEVEKGYSSIDHWKYQGVGDGIIGLRTEWVGERESDRRFTLGLSEELNLPTGHQDDPDVLTDVPIGKGYYELTTNVEAKVTYTFLAFGLKSSLGFGPTTQVERRVPEGSDKIVPKERKSKVNWTPGPDVGGTFYSMLGNSWIRGTYSLGVKKHLKDKYSGSMDGNYDELANGTDSNQVFHEVGVTLTSLRAFFRGNLTVPLVFAFTAHDTFAGTNATKETYFELSVASFFSTPAAAPSEKDKKPAKKTNRKVSSN